MMRRLVVFVRRDFALKMIAVGLATLVWYGAGNKQLVEYTLHAPLEIRNLPENLILLGQPPEDVRVRVRGRGRFLKFRFREFRVAIDASEAEAGLLLRPITTEDVIVPNGVEVEVREVQEPRMLRAEVARKVKRRVPVEPVLAGAPPEGYGAVGGPVVSPAEVEIVGPESVVAPVKVVRLRDLDLSRSRGDVVAKRSVDLSGLPRVEAVPAEVEVRIAVEPVTEARFPAVPVRVQFGEGRLRATVTPEAVAVRLSGPRSRVTSLDADSLVFVIDGEGLDVGRYDYRTDIVGPNRVLLLPSGAAGAEGSESRGANPAARLTLPPEVQLVDVLPSHFSLVVDRAASRRRAAG